MPNQRAQGQKLIAIPVGEEFLVQVDRALPGLGYGDRSSFIRDAIIEKLQREGISIPRNLATAPSRAGKGGSQRKVYPPASKPTHKALNEAALSGAAQLGAKAAIASLGLSPKAASTTYKNAVPRRHARQGKDVRPPPAKPAPAGRERE